MWERNEKQNDERLGEWILLIKIGEYFHSFTHQIFLVKVVMLLGVAL
jgi:hypothetical protein